MSYRRDYFANAENNEMKPLMIKLDLAGTTVHVNANQILYYYAKHNDEKGVVTQLFFTEKFGLEVAETPAEIDKLIEQSGEENNILIDENI